MLHLSNGFYKKSVVVGIVKKRSTSPGATQFREHISRGEGSLSEINGIRNLPGSLQYR